MLAEYIPILHRTVKDMSKVVLALDQALQVSGYAVFKDKKLLVADTFAISKTATMDKRLMEMQKQLTQLYYDYEFSKVVFEDIQLQAGNALTYKHLAYVQATIILWCACNDISYEIFAASHWRKVLGGGFGRKRDEQKQHAIEIVQERYGIEVTSDEADAICIGIAAIKERKENAIGFC